MNILGSYNENKVEKKEHFIYVSLLN